MFYHARNTDVLLNGQRVLASTARISTSTNIKPVYKIGDRNSNDFAIENFPVNELSVSYYLTGSDPIKGLIVSEQNQVSGHFGGLFFNSGYLKNYSVKVVPNEPVPVSASIVFFEPIKGSFAPNSPNLHNISVPIINTANAAIGLTNFNEENYGNITNFSYSFSNSITPDFAIESGTGLNYITPRRIIFGEKTIETQISCDTISGLLEMGGKNAAITVTLNDVGGNVVDSYLVSGKLVSKEFEVQSDGVVIPTIGIRQHQTDNPPSITSIAPYQSNSLNLTPGGSCLVNGSNLTNVTNVYFHDREADNFSFTSFGSVLAKVPRDVISGNVKVRTHGGIVESLPYDVDYEPIIVDYFTPTQAKIGDKVMIYGQNFYRINEIRFAGVSGQFYIIDSNTAMSFVPETVHGQISVGSVLRQRTGISSNSYILNPIISGFALPNGLSGISGVKITVSGKNLSYTNKIIINGIQTTGFVVESNSQIVTYAPSGNSNGPLKCHVSDSFYGQSSSFFEPVAVLSGAFSSSGVTGQTVFLSGFGMSQSLLFPDINGNSFKVRFGGNAVAYFRYFPGGDGTNLPAMLSGQVPSEAAPGIVSLYKPDGVSLHGGGVYFNVIPGPPIVTSLKSSYLFSGKTFNACVYGRNLTSSTTGIIISGIGASTVNSYKIITPNNFTGDVLSTRLSIYNYLFSGSPTGVYSLGALYAGGVSFAPPKYNLISTSGGF